MKTKKARVKLNLKHLSVEEKIGFARQIVTMLTNNPNFAAPIPPLASVIPVIDATETVNAELRAIRQKVAAKMSQLDEQIIALDAVLHQLGAYVENIAGGDESKIKSAGMRVRLQSVRSGIPVAPENLLAAAVGENEIALTWNGVRNARSYIVQITTDHTGQDNWSISQVTTKSKASIKGLVSGQKYWFRVAAVGAAGQGPWSDPATKYAI